MAAWSLRLLAGFAVISSSCASPKIVLRYFNIRGLAEPIRLTLAALDLSYEEIVYDRCGDECPDGIQDWTLAKQEGIESGLFPFGQVRNSVALQGSKEPVETPWSNDVAGRRFHP